MQSLLAENRFPDAAMWHQPLIDSRLLECEFWNRINAHQLQHSNGVAPVQLIPIDLQVGDRVLFGKWSGTETKTELPK
jgi:hypothetical protein